MKRVSFEKMKSEITRVLIKKGFEEEKAEESAELFSKASLDGVYSHGLNRVLRLVEYIDKGWINVQGEPILINSTTFIERYNGNLGPGDLNAKFCMDRAMKLAENNMLGMVTINNTSHWMRGGNYGWQAAESGYIGMCWTNTESCMPPWGAKEQKIGNNPIILAVPNKRNPIVLDMAMSQFSYGKLQVTRLKDEELPIDGGFNEHGQLTRNPGEIENSRRILPMGYWKGSGLSFLLDLIVALLSQGNSTADLDKIKPGKRTSGYGVSQVFIAVDPYKLSGDEFTQQVVVNALDHFKKAEVDENMKEVTYPGENTLKRRKENFKKGIPVDIDIWEKVLSL